MTTCSKFCHKLDAIALRRTRVGLVSIVLSIDDQYLHSIGSS